MRQPPAKPGPQGLLPFHFDESDDRDEVTGRAGLPVLLETMMALQVGQAVKQHIKLRKRNAGFSEAEMVEDLVLLLGVGGECLDDLTIVAADKGLLRLCGRDKLPSPDAARSFLLGYHDEKLLSLARSENPADEASVIYPESAALLGLSRVQEHIVAKMSQKPPSSVATLEMDATIIESHKKEALPHDKGGRGYQPSPAIRDEGAGAAGALRECAAQAAALRRLQPPGAPGFARAKALGPGGSESAGTRRSAAQPFATAHCLGGLNALLVPSSGRHGWPTSLGSQSTASSSFPRSARPECPATATATTTTTLRCPARLAASPWKTAFASAPRGLATLAAELRREVGP